MLNFEYFEYFFNAYKLLKETVFLLVKKLNFFSVKKNHNKFYIIFNIQTSTHFKIAEWVTKDIRNYIFNRAHQTSSWRSKPTSNFSLSSMWKRFFLSFWPKTTHFDPFWCETIYVSGLWKTAEKWFLLQKTHGLCTRSEIFLWIM